MFDYSMNVVNAKECLHQHLNNKNYRFCSRIYGHVPNVGIKYQQDLTLDMENISKFLMIKYAMAIKCLFNIYDQRL